MIKSRVVVFIGIVLLALVSCNKEAITLKNACKLIGEEKETYYINNSSYIKTSGKEYLYNSNNQIDLLKAFEFNSSGEKTNVEIIDSVIYRNEKPSENYYFFDVYGLKKLRHEKFTYNGINISKIDFWEYNFKENKELRYFGTENLKYDEHNLLIERKEVKSDSYVKRINVSHFKYQERNLVEIETFTWSEMELDYEGEPFNYVNDTIKELWNFSNYDSFKNPYKEFIWLYNYRVNSLSENNTRDYNYVRFESDGSVNEAVGGSYVISSYNDNNYPLRIGMTEFIYNCN